MILKIKVKTIKFSTIVRIILLLIVLIDISFFYLLNLPKSFGNYKYLYITIVIIVLCSACCFNTKIKRCTFKYRSFLKYYTPFLLVALILMLFYSQVVYTSQSLVQAFIAEYYFLIILLVYPIIYIMNIDNGYDKIFRMLNAVTFLWYIVMIFQSILYNGTGDLFLKGYFMTDRVVIRSGIRIFSSTLGNIMILYNFNAFYNNYKKKKDLLFYLMMFVLGMYCLLVIQQTRMYTIAIIISLLFLIFSTNKLNTKVIINVLVLSIALLILIQSKSLSVFFTSFTDGKIDTTNVRIDAITYFKGYIIKNPIFGMGLVSYGGNYNSILRGFDGSYYLDDLGFIGLLTKTGFFALSIYVVLIFRFIYIYRRICKKNSCKENGFLLSLLTFLIISSISIIITDPVRIIALPFIFAIFEYKYIQIISK